MAEKFANLIRAFVSTNNAKAFSDICGHAVAPAAALPSVTAIPAFGHLRTFLLRVSWRIGPTPISATMLILLALFRWLLRWLGRHVVCGHLRTWSVGSCRPRTMVDLRQITLLDRDDPAPFIWPASGGAGGFRRFERAAGWRAFIEDLGIDPRIPDNVQAKFKRAQTLYLLAWVDLGLVTAGELAALIALELAVTDRYGAKVSKNKRSFATLLKYMVEADGLTDADIPMTSDGTVIGQLTGGTHPTLAERRNLLAHGDPFDRLPTGGLLELVRDLINYAYREYIAEVTLALGGD